MYRSCLKGSQFNALLVQHKNKCHFLLGTSGNRKLPYEFRHYLWRGCSLSKIFNNVIYVFYMKKYLLRVTWKMLMGVEGIRRNFEEVGGRRRNYSDGSVAQGGTRSFRKWSSLRNYSASKFLQIPPNSSNFLLFPRHYSSSRVTTF